MSKFLICSVVCTMLMTGAFFVYAEGETGQNSGPESVPTAEKKSAPQKHKEEKPISTVNIRNNPLYPELQAKYEQLKALRTEKEGIQNEIRLLNEKNRALESKIREALGGGKAVDKGRFDEQKAEIEALIEKRKALGDRARQLHEQQVISGGGTKGELAALRAQIEALNQQIEERVAALKKAREAAAAEIAEKQGIAEEARSLFHTIREYAQKIESIRIQINQLWEKKADAWQSLSGSIKGGNVSGAIQYMGTVINYEQQIIDKLKEILAIKMQINTALNGILNSGVLAAADAVKKVPADFQHSELEAPVVQ